ncbi:type 1 glutamine amidotransferase [Candidatus Synechococcus calcipolaris G9]|uniref:Type 1 glutamine amidotransferase n=1 Tax=Candidatus Synechococcus calcipolaris G9 TaxID=1497997 RepID=A0ABT6F2Y9_9SYNE|nr:type 1 glutamine amidotransferase [Candidatus Synechococcus calcipolaris]MDG2992146.1 type 1 glutamine amidotransferase [Candidatus Synechococcus calcipolaris G9]
MRLHYLQHVPFEGPANIARWAQEQGHSLVGCQVYQSQEFPALDDLDGLVIMGGPMNVDEGDLYPWLAPEKAFIESVIAAGKPILGICLGAQLLARVLGARVYPGSEKEIGWFPIQPTPAAMELPLCQGWRETFPVFHWHGDTFDLPRGAIHLARSAVCPHQAFLWGDRVLGLQFHLESTPETVKTLIHHCQDELIPAAHIQQPREMLGSEINFVENWHLLQALLGQFFN